MIVARALSYIFDGSVVVVVVDATLPKRSYQHVRAIRGGEGAPEKVQVRQEP